MVDLVLLLESSQENKVASSDKELSNHRFAATQCSHTEHFMFKRAIQQTEYFIASGLLVFFSQCVG